MNLRRGVTVTPTSLLLSSFEKIDYPVKTTPVPHLVESINEPSPCNVHMSVELSSPPGGFREGACIDSHTEAIDDLVGFESCRPIFTYFRD